MVKFPILSSLYAKTILRPPILSQDISTILSSTILKWPFQHKNVIFSLVPYPLHLLFPFLLIIPLSIFELPVRSLISELIESNSYSHLDPLPNLLLKTCLPFLLAIITAILKRPYLDPNNFVDICPISNLPIVSKILEKVVSSQLHTHPTQNILYEQF